MAKARKEVSSEAPRREHGTASISILAQEDPCQASDLQNCKIINVYSFTSLKFVVGCYISCKKTNVHSLTTWQKYNSCMEGAIFNFPLQSWLLYPKFMRPIGPDGSVSVVAVTVCASIFQAIFNATCQLIHLLGSPGIDRERRWGLLFSMLSPPLTLVFREASEESTIGLLVKGSVMGPSLLLWSYLSIIASL